MSIQHKSLVAEILFTLGRSSIPLNSGELYERCALSDKPEQISKSLYELAQHGKIVRAEGPGRARYKLADGVAAPAPAGKSGRPAAVLVPVTGILPAEIPTLADPAISLNGAAGKAKRKPADHIADAGKKVEALPDTDAVRLADAILSKTREQIGKPGARWVIDQAGSVSVFGEAGQVVLSPLQSRMLAEMTLAMHDVLEQHA